MSVYFRVHDVYIFIQLPTTGKYTGKSNMLNVLREIKDIRVLRFVWLYLNAEAIINVIVVEKKEGIPQGSLLHHPFRTSYWMTSS